jgi:broad specificity phosphatase PhoE
MEGWCIFLRHAHRETGWENDNGLSPKGQAQGARLRSYLAAFEGRYRPEKVFTSPKLRCRETAEYVAEWAGVPVQVLPALDEQHRSEDERQFRARLARFIGSIEPRTVYCSHGDVLPLFAQSFGASSGVDVAKGDLFIVESGRITALNPLSKLP